MSEEIRPRKKARIDDTQNPFLDIEAQVSDASEDEEADYIEESLQESDAEEDVFLHRQLFREIENSQNEKGPWFDLLNSLEAGIRNRGSRILDEGGVNEDENPKLPRLTDSLFEVPCPVGLEESLVFRLMSIAFQLPNPTSFALSIFARKGIPGRIYVETSSFEKAAAVARSIPELSESRIQAVPSEWMLKVLTPPQNSFPQSPTWVRIHHVHERRHRVYLGDTGLAIRHLDARHISVAVIPRVFRHGSLPRPPQMLLTTSEYLERETCTEDGLILLRLVEDSVSWGSHIFPTAEELRIFRSCSIMDTNMAEKTEQSLLRQAFKYGDRVKVCCGSLRGLIGRVMDTSENSVEVSIEALDVIESLTRGEIRMDFLIGDEVRVIAGEWKDRVCFIVDVSENYATVFDPESHLQGKVYLNDMEFHEKFERICLRDLSRPSSVAIRSGWAEKRQRMEMQHDPNAKFIGKTVMVTGQHILKGSTGVVKATSSNGDVFVQLNIFNRGAWEKISLEFLRIYRDDKVSPLFSRRASSASVPPPPPSLSRPATPMLAANETPPPSSPQNTAAIDLEHGPWWLTDPRIQGRKIKLMKDGVVTPPYLVFESAAGETVTVKEGWNTVKYQLSRLSPLPPAKKSEAVICFADNEHFGALFRIKTYGADECVVKDFYNARSKTTHTIPTTALASVCPP